MAKRVKVLFLCVGNSCRSQMAEAIARHKAADIIEPSSAGLAPLGEVAPATLKVLDEAGISAAGQSSKPVRPEELAAVDLVINITGRPAAAIFRNPAPPVEDWDVQDPFSLDLKIYREIRDEIDARIQDLAQRLRKHAGAQQATWGSVPDELEGA
jgi:arsenate reductase (thioredoxin)